LIANNQGVCEVRPYVRQPIEAVSEVAGVQKQVPAHSRSSFAPQSAGMVVK